MFANGPADLPPGIYAGGPIYDAVLDQSAQAVFTNTASGGAIATFVVELASSSLSNVFGLYDAEDPTKKVQLFAGADGPGDQTLVSFLADGRVLVFFVDSGVTGFSGRFGFYIDVFDAPVALGGDGNPTTFDYAVFTEDSLNPGQRPQSLLYRGNNATSFALPGFAPGVFGDSNWVVAFEDGLLASGQSDGDFSDLVVLVESLVPPQATAVPAASTWGLAIFGLLLLTVAKIRFSPVCEA